MHPHRNITHLRGVAAFIAFAALCLSSRATDILFVGNSFTREPAGQTEPGGTGTLKGVAAIFSRLATQGGHAGLTISMKEQGGQTLTWHQTNSIDVIDRRWDIVVLQDYSTRTFTDLPGFNTAISDLSSILRAQNPGVSIYLYETWARPDKVGAHGSLAAQTTILHDAYSNAAAVNHLAGWVPVGDAFLNAVSAGYANDPSTPVSEGPLSLWGSDNYHQSVTGAYLAAVLFYHDLLGGDISLIPTGTGSVAAGLNISAADAAKIHAIALQTIPEPAMAGAVASLAAGCFCLMRRKILSHRNAGARNPETTLL